MTESVYSVSRVVSGTYRTDISDYSHHCYDLQKS